MKKKEFEEESDEIDELYRELGMDPKYVYEELLSNQERYEKVIHPLMLKRRNVIRPQQRKEDGT